MKALIGVAAILLQTLLMVLTAYVPKAAAAGSLYFSPSTRAAQQGVNFTIAVRANAIDPTNGIQVNLTFPAAQIDYVSHSLSGSATPLEAEKTLGSGTFVLAAGVSPGSPSFTGDKLIATFTFRAKVASGSGQIAFAAGTSLVNDSGTPHGSGGGPATVTFSPKAAAPPAPVVDKTAPTISDLNASSTGPKNMTITWKTNEASSSIVEFGLEDKLGLSITGEGGNVLEHSVVLSEAYVEPGATVFYRVKSVDAGGNAMTSDIKQFVVPGVKANVTVKAKGGGVIKGATVTYGDQKVETNDAGKATVENVAVGKQTFTVTKGDKSQAFTVEVKTDSTEQNFEFEMEGVSSSAVDPKILGGLVLLLLLAAAVVWFIKKRGGGGGFPGMPWKKDGMVVGGATPSSSPSSDSADEKVFVNGKTVDK